MRRNEQSLLEHLAMKMGYERMSDLRYLNDLGKEKLELILSGIEPNDFELHQWNDLLEYLTHESAQTTAEKAHDLLCLQLKEY